MVATLSFTLSEEVPASPEVRVGDTPAVLASEAGTAYAFTYAALGSEAEGPAPVSIRATDSAGNGGTTAAGQLWLDFTPPVVTVEAAADSVPQGRVLSVTVGVDEELTGAPVLTAFGIAGSCWATGAREFACGITVPVAQPPGAVEVSVAARDLVGNRGSGGAEVLVTQAGGAIRSLEVAPAFARAGEVLGIDFAVSRPPDAPAVVTVAGLPAECEADGLEHTCSYTVSGVEGEGAQPVLVQATFDALPAQAQASVRFDFGAPSLLSVVPSRTAVGPDVPVTLELVFSETLAAPPEVVLADDTLPEGACQPEGPALRYECSFTPTDATPEGPAEVTLAGADLAGNPMQQQPLPAGVRVDQTLPDVVSVVGVPEHVPGGGTTQVSLRASEPLHALGVALVGCVDDALALACRPTGLDLADFRCGPFTLPDLANEGACGLSVTLEDQGGNVAEVVADDVVQVDDTPPVLEVSVTPDPLPRTQIPTFLVRADEPLGAFPTVEAAFLEGEPGCSGVVPGRAFSCSGAMVAAEVGEGDQVFSASGVDRAGNPGDVGPETVEVRNPPPR